VERWQNTSKMVHPQTMVVHQRRCQAAKRYENPQFGEFKEPATVLDQHGHIILWHLPFIISLTKDGKHFLLFCYTYPQYLTDPQSDLSGLPTVGRTAALDSFMNLSIGSSKKPLHGATACLILHLVWDLRWPVF